MNEQDILVVEAMERYGGPFAKALAQLCWHADPNNLQIIKTAFSEYWDQYSHMPGK